MNVDPVPPTNVRIIRADGSVIPLELVFSGRDVRGDAVWTNPVPVHLPDELRELRCGVVPVGCVLDIRTSTVR